ncbi:methylenetetrahydrofolate reductase [Kineococcus esterisolvens]|uniref:methylenetetrahydrofolate reductase n=1 Tax=unclassified Kineococcus TaxID=2621656 RepID=UPI003D7E3027
MEAVHPEPGAALHDVLQDFSLEMTGKDVPRLQEARAAIPPGTRINVTHLANEDLQMRVAAAEAVRDCGFVPVPHISARRLESAQELQTFLEALQRAGASSDVFVVGGDPPTPAGPYEDSLAVIRSGLLQQHGVRHVSVSGYPEGHPDITDPVLWQAIEAKATALREQGLRGSVTTQFGFDVDPVFTWLEEVRARGIDLPVRIGVPGPAGIRRLLGYAQRFGVGTSAGIAKKYGFSITNLVGTAGPATFVRTLTERYDPQRHGGLRLHFYTFGGLKATSEWIGEFRGERQ